MRSDFSHLNEPSEDPDDALARWEAYRALMRRTGDIEMMPWLEEDDAEEAQSAPRWSGVHAEHPSFAPIDPLAPPDGTAEPEAPVDAELEAEAPDVSPPPRPRQGVWPLSARLFGAMATLVAGLALIAALVPRHPDLAARAGPPFVLSGLGGLARLAANDAPGLEPPSGVLPDSNAAPASGLPGALARPSSLQQPPDARHAAILSRSCRHCRRAARTHHRSRRCWISRTTGHRRCRALTSPRWLTEARYRLR